jgi:hypothetical protein
VQCSKKNIYTLLLDIVEHETYLLLRARRDSNTFLASSFNYWTTEFIVFHVKLLV